MLIGGFGDALDEEIDLIHCIVKVRGDTNVSIPDGGPDFSLGKYPHQPVGIRC